MDLVYVLPEYFVLNLRPSSDDVLTFDLFLMDWCSRLPNDISPYGIDHSGFAVQGVVADVKK